jgi:hypothetical protein
MATQWTAGSCSITGWRWRIGSTAISSRTTTPGKLTPRSLSRLLPQPRSLALTHRGPERAYRFAVSSSSFALIPPRRTAFCSRRYGASTGVPSEDDTYADILAVYDHLVALGVAPKDELIVYGQSVGTGPSCHLAAHRPIAGLVLHSPMVSYVGTAIHPPACGLSTHAATLAVGIEQCGLSRIRELIRRGVSVNAGDGHPGHLQPGRRVRARLRVPLVRPLPQRAPHPANHRAGTKPVCLRRETTSVGNASGHAAQKGQG